MAVRRIRHLPDAGNGADLSDMAKQGNTLKEILDTQAPTDDFDLITDLDLESTSPKPVEWIVDGLIAKDVKTVIGGTTGANKSFLGMEIGIRVANGVDHIMDYKINGKMRVLYLNFEVSDDEVNRRYHQITDSIGVKASGGFILNKKNERTKSFIDQWDNIDKMIMKSRPDLVIVDNLYASTGVNLSKNDEIKKVLGRIDDVMHDHGVTMVLIAHFNKPIGETELTLERMQGASSLMNWLEFGILLGKSSIDPDLRLMRIGKSRISYVTGEHMGLEWTNEDFLFKKRGLVENPAAHFIAKKSADDWAMALDRLSDRFDMSMFVNVVQFEMGKTERTAYRWIKNMAANGFVTKDIGGIYKKTGLEIIKENES